MWLVLASDSAESLIVAPIHLSFVEERTSEDIFNLIDGTACPAGHLLKSILDLQRARKSAVSTKVVVVEIVQSQLSSQHHSKSGKKGFSALI